MLDRQGVYTKVEIASRYEILLDNYIKTIQVEALTAVKMVKTQIYPAACDYLAKVSSEVVAAKEAGIPAAFLTDDATKLANLLQEAKDKLTTLENNIAKAQASDAEIFETATMWKDEVFGMMQSLRETVDTIEEAWNRKYQEYLGFTPKNHQEGILQDVHWASGCVGYFQGYALGDAYAAQFAHKLLADCPDAFEKLGKGDSSVIGNWLKEHIHQYGQTYSTREMLKKATGEELNTGYYIEYLKEKYLH